MQQISDVKQIGEASVAKLLLKFSIPAILGMVVNATYGIIDSIFVTQKFGPNGLAATAVTIPIMLLMLSAGMMIGIGTSTLLSIRIGEKRIDDAERLFGVAMFLFFIVAILFMIFGFVFMEPLLYLFGANEKILPMSKEFFSVILAGVIFSVVSFGVNGFLRSEGKVHIAMITLLISAFSNIVLVWFFLFVLDTGIWGSALATVIAQAISSVWIIWYYFSGRTLIRWKIQYTWWNGGYTKEILRMGIAPCVMNLANALVIALTNLQFNTYGQTQMESTEAIAIMRIIQSILTIVLMVILGITQGAQPIIGYNTGARKFDRVFKVLVLAVSVSLIITSAVLAVVLFFPEWLIRPFLSGDTNLHTPEFAQKAARALWICLMLLPGTSLVITTSNYFQASGRAMLSLLITLTRQVFILIPLILILPKSLGIDGVWYATPISDGCVFAVCLFLLGRELLRLNAVKNDRQTISAR